MGVIYLRTNKINGKKYVGQAVDIERRQREWKYLSFRYGGKAINNARAKYGLDAFDFEMVRHFALPKKSKTHRMFRKELQKTIKVKYRPAHK